MLLVSPLVTCRNKDKWLLLIARGMHKSCLFMEEGSTRRHSVTGLFGLMAWLPVLAQIWVRAGGGCSVLVLFAFPRVIPCCRGGKCLSHGMGAAGSWQCFCWLSLWWGGLELPSLGCGAQPDALPKIRLHSKAVLVEIPPLAFPLLLLSMVCASLHPAAQFISPSLCLVPWNSSWEHLQELSSLLLGAGQLPTWALVLLDWVANPPPHPGLGFIPSLSSQGKNLPDPWIKSSEL